MDEMPKRIWACENGQWMAEWFNPPLGAQFVRADLAQAPAPVRVKPLVWAHKVKMPSGNLEVRTQDDGRVEFFTHCGLYTIRDRGTQEAPMYILRRLAAPIMGSAKLSELYDAAQKDHTARILAALEAPDAGGLVAYGALSDDAIAALAAEQPGKIALLPPRRRGGGGTGGGAAGAYGYGHVWPSATCRPSGGPRRPRQAGGAVMGQSLALALMLYIVAASVLVPIVAVDVYLKTRDCRVTHQVDACPIIFVPAGETP